MELRRYQDVDEFSAAAEAFLIEHEAENNLLLGIANDLARTTLYKNQPAYLATVVDRERVVAAALRTPPHNLVISRACSDAARMICADIRSAHRDLPGVLGPKEASLAFSIAWKEETTQPFKLGVAQRIYQLDKATKPHHVSGNMRQATRSDSELLRRWLRAFDLETFGERDGQEIAQRRLRAYFESETRGLFLWDDGEPVSLAGFGGPTPHGIRVGPVYTPDKFRRRGYASAITAALSQHLLDAGYRYCFLFTDLNNPTSNSIYQRIGYRPVADVDEYRFG